MEGVGKSGSGQGCFQRAQRNGLGGDWLWEEPGGTGRKQEEGKSSKKMRMGEMIGV